MIKVNLPTQVTITPDELAVHKGYVFIDEPEYFKLMLLVETYEGGHPTKIALALAGAIQTIRALVDELE